VEALEGIRRDAGIDFQGIQHPQAQVELFHAPGLHPGVGAIGLVPEIQVIGQAGLQLELAGVDRVRRVGLVRPVGVHVAHQVARGRFPQGVRPFVRGCIRGRRPGVGGGLIGSESGRPHTHQGGYERDTHPLHGAGSFSVQLPPLSRSWMGVAPRWSARSATRPDSRRWIGSSNTLPVITCTESYCLA
jgi:hypothetical protein